jgi:hypothetical protein
VEYTPIADAGSIGTIRNMEEFLESAKEMETNQIILATEENLPVHLLH